MSYEHFFKRYRKFTVGKQVMIHVGRKAERTLKLSRARPTMALVDPATGETSKAFLLMAYLPLGSPSYAEPKMDAWLSRNAQEFTHIGSSTRKLYSMRNPSFCYFSKSYVDPARPQQQSAHAF